MCLFTLFHFQAATESLPRLDSCRLSSPCPTPSSLWSTPSTSTTTTTITTITTTTTTITITTTTKTWILVDAGRSAPHPLWKLSFTTWKRYYSNFILWHNNLFMIFPKGSKTAFFPPTVGRCKVAVVQVSTIYMILVICKMNLYRLQVCKMFRIYIVDN